MTRDRLTEDEWECTRGGFSPKVHLPCDVNGHPLHFHLTPGQSHEVTALRTLLERADEEIVDQGWHAVARPVALIGDKGFRADWIDKYLLSRGITPVIPSRENEDRSERPVEFDGTAY